VSLPWLETVKSATLVEQHQTVFNNLMTVGLKVQAAELICWCPTHEPCSQLNQSQRIHDNVHMADPNTQTCAWQMQTTLKQKTLSMK
jgi:hypothetical protein